MKALRSHAIGGPETLVVDDLPIPEPGPGEVRIRVSAVGVNFPDTLIIRDLYQYKPERPFSPGIELAGVIEACGTGANRFRPGDRVLALPSWGAMCEQVVVAEDRVHPLPAGIADEVAAALPLAYGTTLYALQNRAALKSGETLLVLGAAGGVGLSAVEIGKAMGARVIGAVSSEEKRATVLAAGADDCVIYGRPPFDKDQSRALANALKAACGPSGADVIYDAVGGDYAEPAIRAIAFEGRYLVIGFAAGIPRLPLNLTLLKSCDIRGVFYGGWIDQKPQELGALLSELMAMVVDGRVRPLISQVLPLERGGEAIALLADRKALGKVVVRVAD
jgi:NADPH2:quinone reductase